MKKILLATTLLAATAGYASAEVAISGSARMGLVQSRVGAHAAVADSYVDGWVDGDWVHNGVLVPGSEADEGSIETQFTSRVRVNFDASGTTDGGLSFGASVRADQSGQGGTANGDSTVWISGAFGKLTFGDVAGGAADNLVGQISGVGFTGLGDTNEIRFLDGTATAARYDYTSGALSVSVGASQTTAADGVDKASVAVAYNAGAYNVAVGYETVTGDNLLSIKGGATFGAATVTVKYAKAKDADAEAGISLDYAVSPALTVTAFYTDHVSHQAKGVGASYDLGGGAKVVGGVVDNGADTLADIGVKMSF